MTDKLTVVVLTYNRNENCQLIVDTYEQYDFVDEILVASNDGFIPKSKNGKTKTTIFDNKKDGLYARFILASTAKNEAIFLTDDDFLLSQQDLKKMFLGLISLPDKIHGVYGRDLYFNFLYARFFDSLDRDADIVLPGISLVTRTSCKSMLCFLHDFRVSLLKRINIFAGFNKDNGEDILFSFIAKKNFFQKHKTYKVNIIHLNTVTGSISKRGITFRLCRNLATWIGMSLFFSKQKVNAS